MKKLDKKQAENQISPIESTNTDLMLDTSWLHSNSGYRLCEKVVDDRNTEDIIDEMIDDVLAAVMKHFSSKGNFS